MATSFDISLFLEKEWCAETNVLQQNTLILGVRTSGKTPLCCMMSQSETKYFVVRPFYCANSYSNMEQKFVCEENELTVALHKKRALGFFMVIDCNDLPTLADNALFKTTLVEQRQIVITALVPADHEKLKTKMLFGSLITPLRVFF
jgi:hypothetical protein